MIYLLISNFISMVLIVFAYSLGLRQRQKLDSGETVSVLPTIEIPNKINKEQEKKQVEEFNRLNKIYQNIENWDGKKSSQVKID